VPTYATQLTSEADPIEANGAPACAWPVARRPSADREATVAKCDAVIDITAALFDVPGRELRRSGRSTADINRARQIAMYVAHVVLRVSMRDVGLGFGRDRTTVVHACHLIEDLRDDAEFDGVVTTVERVTKAAFPWVLGADRQSMPTAKMNDSEARQIVRILRFLGTAGAIARQAAGRGRVLLEASEKGTISVRRDDLAAVLRRGLVEHAGQGRLRRTQEGEAMARRSEADGQDAFAIQHQERRRIEIEGPGGRERVTINLSESPLSNIARRRGRDGGRFLTDEEFAAGERLRADYERARIMPRLGINWDAPVSGDRRSGRGSGIEELTEMVLAARRRVEAALEAVGPELSGILVDICCFLKGMERVEIERGWPARSAKVMLKSALSALDRHYRPPPRKTRTVLHWGALDYRPSIAGADQS
jgi:hypothetical protein